MRNLVCRSAARCTPDTPAASARRLVSFLATLLQEPDPGVQVPRDRAGALGTLQALVDLRHGASVLPSPPGRDSVVSRGGGARGLRGVQALVGGGVALG